MKTIDEKSGLELVVERLPALRVLAAELFDEVGDFEFVDDPELPDSQYVSLLVRTKCSPKDAAALRREWYRRIHGVLEGRTSLVHLAIDIIE